MKKLALIGLLLISQLSYASDNELIRRVEADTTKVTSCSNGIAYGCGCAMAIIGVTMIAIGVRSMESNGGASGSGSTLIAFGTPLLAIGTATAGYALSSAAKDDEGRQFPRHCIDSHECELVPVAHAEIVR